MFDSLKTVTGEYHAILLDHLNNEIKKKRLRVAKKKMFFHQDNAPPCASMKATIKLNE